MDRAAGEPVQLRPARLHHGDAAIGGEPDRLPDPVVGIKSRPEVKRERGNRRAERLEDGVAAGYHLCRVPGSPGGGAAPRTRRAARAMVSAGSTVGAGARATAGTPAGAGARATAGILPRRGAGRRAPPAAALTVPAPIACQPGCPRPRSRRRATAS